MSEEKQMGVVSEEALDEIAGGFKVLGKDITKADVEKALGYAGVCIGLAGLTVLGIAGAKRLFGGNDSAQIDNNDEPTDASGLIENSGTEPKPVTKKVKNHYEKVKQNAALGLDYYRNKR